MSIMTEHMSERQNPGTVPVSQRDEDSASHLSKSWGDAYKKVVFNKVTYVGLNYFVNAIGSGTLAYGAERKYLTPINNFSQAAAAKISSLTGLSSSWLQGGIYGGVRTLLLTSVGTALVPVIRTLENNRHSLEFGIGHKLDRLQEAMGKSNEASRENIADFHKIQSATSKPESVEFTPEERERLWKKHHIELTDLSGKVTFDEHKLPWGKVLAARLAGFVAAFSSNFLLHSTKNNQNKLVNYDTYEKGAAGLANKVLTKIPGYTKAVADPERFAGILFNDSILTASSSSAHKFVQGLLHKDPDEPVKEKKHHGDHIKKIVANGSKDFTAREHGKTSGAQASLG